MTDEHGDGRTASELRHRMANTFQLMAALARMRGQKAGDPEARRQLTWMADAIGSLGALERHRLDAGVDFAAYLADMTPVWQRRQGARPAEVRLACEPVQATDQAASTLALIAQELVSNAMTHGYPDGRVGVVQVGLRRLADDRYELTVVDDGQGFDPASPGARERFGLWFVRSLAAQVRGEFSLECQDGVAARLVFSL